MPNDFYTPTGNPADNSNIVSADMRAEFAAINAGFNKLPTLTGNANKLVVINSSGTGMDVTVAPAGLTSINKVAITQPANGATLTILDGKTLTANHSLTLAGTDGTVMTFPATSATLARTDAANTFTGIQDFDGRIDANAGLAVTGANFTSRGITDAATATVVSLSGSGANSITIANSATDPTIGTSAGNLVVGSAGQTSAIFSSNVATANYLRFESRAAAGISPIIWAEGTGANIGIEYRTKASGSHHFITDGSTGSVQVSVTHTALADRHITLTGSAGGNPTIGTSAGALQVSSGAAAGATNYIYTLSNLNGSTPALASAVGVMIGANISAGNSEVNFINPSYTAGVSFDFRQVTSSGVSASLLRLVPVASGARYIDLTQATAAGNPKIAASAGSLDIGSAVVFTSQTVGTTVGAAGGASALPATPLGYITTAINGTACKIPYYN